MAQPILIDELHLTVFAPPRLRAESLRAIRRTLRSGRFPTALRRAIDGVLARYAALGKATFTLSR